MSIKNTLLNFAIFIISITLIPSFIYEYQLRDPSLFFIPKTSILLITIGIVIWYFHNPDEEDDDDYNINTYEDNIYYKPKYNSNNKNRNKDISSCKNSPYCQRSDSKVYDNISRSYTKDQLNELVKKDLFKKMLEEKGEDKENWNWQSRDRLKGKIQKNESDISSDEIENMSVSDD